MPGRPIRASSVARASSTSSSAHSESPTECPCAARNGKHIAPPIRIVSATSRKRSMTAILSLTLAPPSTATSGRAGSSSSLRQRLHLALEQQPRGALGHQLRDPLGRGVRAVRGAERVVDVDVGELGQRRGQLGVVLGLAGLVADVLEQQDLPRREVVGERVDVVADGRRARASRRRRAARRAGRRPAAATARARGPSAGPGARRARSGRPGRRSSSIVGSAARMRVSSAIEPSSSGTLKSTRTSTRLPSRSPRSARVLTTASGRGRRPGSSSPTRCRTRRRP